MEVTGGRGIEMTINGPEHDVHVTVLKKEKNIGSV